MRLGSLERSLKQFYDCVERLRSAALQTYGEGVDDSLSVDSG